LEVRQNGEHALAQCQLGHGAVAVRGVLLAHVPSSPTGPGYWAPDASSPGAPASSAPLTRTRRVPRLSSGSTTHAWPSPGAPHPGTAGAGAAPATRSGSERDTTR